jgi:hypothetical protein
MVLSNAGQYCMCAGPMYLMAITKQKYLLCTKDNYFMPQFTKTRLQELTHAVVVGNV